MKVNSKLLVTFQSSTFSHIPYQLPSAKIRKIYKKKLYRELIFFAQFSYVLTVEKTTMRKFLQILLLIASSCYVMCKDSSPKIVGGFNVTSLHGFKHQVSIRDLSHEFSSFGSGHLCGGSLIDYDTVSFLLKATSSDMH